MLKIFYINERNQAIIRNVLKFASCKLVVFEWVTKEDEEITDDDNGDDDVFKIKGNTLLHWEDCQITQRRRYLLWALNGEMKQKKVC